MNRVGRFPTESEEFMKYSIHVTEAKNQAGNVRGFANLVFGDSFKITNIAILENKEKGTLFVSMPRYKSSERDENGGVVYKDVCNPITAEFREELYGNILEAFEQEKSADKSQAGNARGEAEMPQFSVTVTPYEREGSNIRGLARIYFDDSFIHSGKNANWNKINKAKTSKVTPLACDTWERVKIVREKSRPTSMDYINAIFNDFFEVSGDRIFGDDKAIVTGLATFHGKSFTVIGEQKGKRTLDDAVYRNFGMPSPEGYRKALRAINQAEKFKRPIVCFVDTIGAACGVDAEKRGQGLAIAELLSELSVAKTPILSIIIGEGYSGGALALAVGNAIWMLDNAVYSIISPEGYSSIMWGTNDRRQEAAEKMKMSSAELYRMNIVDKVIAEGGKVTMDNIDEVSEFIECEIIEFCNKYCNKSIKRVVQERQNRYRKY